eukprot:1445004-Pyramimonas_sp.AAC.1
MGRNRVWRERLRQLSSLAHLPLLRLPRRSGMHLYLLFFRCPMPSRPCGSMPPIPQSAMTESSWWSPVGGWGGRCGLRWGRIVPPLWPVGG